MKFIHTINFTVKGNTAIYTERSLSSKKSLSYRDQHNITKVTQATCTARVVSCSVRCCSLPGIYMIKMVCIVSEEEPEKRKILSILRCVSCGVLRL